MDATKELGMDYHGVLGAFVPSFFFFFFISVGQTLIHHSM